MTAPHRFRLRVYWEDTDAGGIVYHSNYLKFAERARTEMVRGLGVGQAELAAAGHAFAVAHAEVAFRAPARLDDELEVVSSLHAVGGASLEMGQAINRLDERTELVRLNIRLAFIALDGGRPVRLPADLRRSLADYVSERRD